MLPGLVNMELFLKVKSEELLHQIADLFLENRIGIPEDIIPMSSFFYCDEAQWITGQCPGVNRGMA